MWCDMNVMFALQIMNGNAECRHSVLYCEINPDEKTRWKAKKENCNWCNCEW